MFNLEKIKISLGTLLGILMFICITLSIKVSNNSYLGNYVFDSFDSMNYRIAVIVIFFVSMYLTGKLLKDVNAVFLNWGKMLITIVMVISFASYMIV